MTQRKAPTKSPFSDLPEKSEKKKAKSTERPKLRRGRTHTGERAAEIVMRPALKMMREDTDTAVVAWGRMNPPTVGHARLVERVAELAEDVGGYPMLFLSPTVGVKNPLTLNERLDLVTDAFGDFVNIEEAESVVDPISLLKYVSEHFDRVVVVTGEEHKADYERFFRDYNGKEFTFESCQVTTMTREKGSESLDESISATQMREYALNQDIEKFTAGLPQALKMDADHIMERVAFGIALNEAADTADIATKAIVKYRNIHS